jgi:hypothetical protein
MAEANHSLSQLLFTENSPAMVKRKPKIIRKPVAPPVNEWQAATPAAFFFSKLSNEMEKRIDSRICRSFDGWPNFSSPAIGPQRRRVCPRVQ